MRQTNNEPQPSRLLPTVIEAVAAAGSRLREAFHRQFDENTIKPVERDVEGLLRERLLAAHPCGWRGEETGRIVTDGRDRWVVDPLDGTGDFVKGRRGSAISVALLRDGVPVLGVVHAPVAPDHRGDLIAWAEGAPLTRNGVTALPSPARSRPIIALNADAADFALANHLAWDGARVRALPSPAYRLALAAVGEVDAAVSMTRALEEWDIAGGHALLIGAGKALVDGHGRDVVHGHRAIARCVGGSAAIVARLVPLKCGAVVPARKPFRLARPVSDAGRLARGQGCLLGLLAGDALGSAVEFQHAAEIARLHPQGVTTLEDGGTWDLMAGQPTDDGELALALARALTSCGRFDQDVVGKAYVRWRRSSPFDMGGTTARGIDAIAAQRDVHSDSQANGALMRVAPVGIFAAGNPAEAARLAALDAGLTHPHPVCRAASGAYAAAIAAGIAGAAPEAMWAAAVAAILGWSGAEPVRDRLSAARDAAPPDYQTQMGWVLTALQNAFHWLLDGVDLGAAVIGTVARGGDTDTNAAICGGLLGAAYGREAVPRQWQDAVLTCRSVPAPGVRHPRPSDYWPDDALELAEALLSAGAS